MIGHAAEALAGLGAVESLPSLRAALRRTSKGDSSRAACEGAITELEARTALPRPAEAEDSGGETLPRSASEPTAGTDTLPKPSAGDPPQEG